ncbi:FAD-dependent oxidoreductase [Cereibacter sphaeroides]|uniref:FAD-dependent oxidoreductase n=1 Tax=Rhodobacterales TaxID=204455 RepID=UPI000BBE32CA|nr:MULTISPECIES: FAD-dependent oxidoreductase [Paracoccaceae]MCE6950090.1 FAD-dependent oxidoreductase [Cereibacter sphaeroides]MCE6958194.1 FAD-dependent oxidoreductase [Cereibacter sphaeroides]MCE6967673.1 FAD-dependent oxidoreductase [Cereibacter sphaeroides]MCE6972484.1 FAD-dependent oxidoreductase [Cereibacter sphaeroides]
MKDHFDAIVVGAGPSGNACAYTMAKAGMNVLQIDRGEYPGSKNVQGAILYSDALERIIPDFREDAPLERHVGELRFWMLSEHSHSAGHYRTDQFEGDKPDRYTILRAPFDKWFSKKVREAGATLITETTVTNLVKNDEGRVVGVETDREGGPIFADVVVLAEGVNGVVGQRAKLRPEVKPQHVALAVKETHFFPEETIRERFNLQGEDDGVVIEVLGSVSSGMVGTGFLYTNKESISIGVGCILSDFTRTQISPYELLDKFKNHPSVRPLIRGGEMKEYVAHLIPEGGYDAIPNLTGDGWMIVGDAGQFVNAVHREGSNLAMTTGRLAAESLVELKAKGLPPTNENLKLFRDKLADSFVMKDLKKYRKVPHLLEKNRQLFNAYPAEINRAIRTYFRVDGMDKKSKEGLAIRNLVRGAGGWFGVAKDFFKLARAWR